MSELERNARLECAEIRHTSKTGARDGEAQGAARERVPRGRERDLGERIDAGRPAPRFALVSLDGAMSAGALAATLPHLEMITMKASRSSFRAAPALLLALGLAGCAPPLQNGGVTIFGDPSTRLAALCRFRHQAGDGFCFDEATEESPAGTPVDAADAKPRSDALGKAVSAEGQGADEGHAPSRAGDGAATSDGAR